MKITFEITDEKTVTNTTVKLTASVRAVVNGESRDKCEERALAAVKEILPDARWAFSNYRVDPDGLTFTVMASTRVGALEDDGLAERAAKMNSDTRVTFHAPDYSIPQHDIRTTESELRKQIIALAQKEAENLSGAIHRITFETGGMSFSNAKSANYTASAMAGGGSPVSIGHSEKISMTATVTLNTDGKPAKGKSK